VKPVARDCCCGNPRYGSSCATGRSSFSEDTAFPVQRRSALRDSDDLNAQSAKNRWDHLFKSVYCQESTDRDLHKRLCSGRRRARVIAIPMLVAQRAGRVSRLPVLQKVAQDGTFPQPRCFWNSAATLPTLWPFGIRAVLRPSTRCLAISAIAFQLLDQPVANAPPGAAHREQRRLCISMARRREEDVPAHGSNAALARIRRPCGGRWAGPLRAGRLPQLGRSVSS
jgi:hypothetical protein